jgi:hypothetical protein
MHVTCHCRNLRGNWTKRPGKLRPCSNKGGRDATVREAVQLIITALQGQDRIEQRCHNMALAVRQFALLPPTAPDSVYDEIWASLTLDELRVPALSGIAAHQMHGEAELF